jgi:(S)-2-hydroxyglutarate dehydrogenase
VIVATDQEESARLENLRQRGEKNGIRGIRRLVREELRELEPNCAGVAGLHIPSTGITDYRKVCSKYLELLQDSGGTVHLGCEVKNIRRGTNEFVLETPKGSFRAAYIINCAGLHSDTVSRMTGAKTDIQIVPFRGEYYDLRPERQGLVRGLIYPVPDPQFPFLGVHFTRHISGGVDAGPNSVLAFKREGYSKFDFSFRDLARVATFPGFWRMALKHWRSRFGEFYRSFSKGAFVRALQRLVTEITASDLLPRAAGIRAQALRADGSLLDDFEFQQSDRVLNVCNVPSPAATASIPIGCAIVTMARNCFSLQPD